MIFLSVLFIADISNDIGLFRRLILIAKKRADLCSEMIRILKTDLNWPSNLLLEIDFRAFLI